MFAAIIFQFDSGALFVATSESRVCVPLLGRLSAISGSIYRSIMVARGREQGAKAYK